MNKNLDCLEKHEYYIALFSFYEKLFTDKQIEYFKDYYFYDLGLSEIATNHEISRSAVFDTINKMNNMLDEYEEKLKLYQNFNKLNELCDLYSLKAEETNNELVKELIGKLKEE